MKSNDRQGNRPNMMAMLLTMLAAVVMFAGAAVPAHAQTPTILHAFPLAKSDACDPEDNIVQGRAGNRDRAGVTCGTSSDTGYKISTPGTARVVSNLRPTPL